MKQYFLGPWLAIALLTVTGFRAVADDPPRDLDLRRAVPDDAFMAVYGKHNPERDYQRDYYRQVWQTVQETQIIERAVKIATKRMSADDLEKARGVMDQLKEAAAPIDLEAIFNCEEAVYGQQFQLPTAQHVAAFRLSSEAAAGLEQGLTNLFRKAEQLSERQRLGGKQRATGQHGHQPPPASASSLQSHRDPQGRRGALVVIARFRRAKLQSDDRRHGTVQVR